ncbi:MAG: accessory Sec system glycosylation chaperone GtfB [Pseudobutyrivibrio sp.]|nr:accessory Sec system glycosylation chaperone GtfB [Pseudobutyrivibrio sp.]
MEKTNREEIVLLFDYFNIGSQDLLASFQNANYKVQAIVINDEGFLPEDVENVFEYFLGDMTKAKDCPKKPLYFNQIKTPEYWQISGNNTSGSIHDKSKERGRIFYAEPKNKRLVKVVDWLDEDGNVRASDHYNKYGMLYARTIFNRKSQKVSKSYFDGEGKEVIIENFVTSDIVLNTEGTVQIFKGRTEFVVYYLRRKGLENNRIFFNSLSVPFFVSNALPQADYGKGDILFWQEQTRDEIPGNMLLIFDGKANRCGRIIVQNHPSYERLRLLNAPEEAMDELGYIYSFKKKNLGRPSALICTNTENVEKLKEIVEALPEVKFHVAAITEMSGKLLSHEKYDNVIMYPNIKMVTLERLFWECDFYLDINHEGEIVDSMRKAFIHNHLIVAFNETAHGLSYTAVENRFDIKDYKKLIERVRILVQNKEKLKVAVHSQQRFALTATPEDYKF